MKKLLLFLIFSLISGSILFCNVAAQKVEFVQKDDKIDVLFDGKKITSYVFTDTLTKPIIYPLLSPSGTILTRQYPFAKIEGEATDHKHHTGLFFTFDGAN
ncbi:PmoA family protein, partial [candidate division KSB1 bacterium]|nr:PmoA family protein [candidate division KSB1 bacterium]